MKKTLLAIIFLFIFPITSALGADLYTHPSAYNDSDCTCQATGVGSGPCSFVKAVSCVSVNGADTIYMEAGTYQPTAMVTISIDGTSSTTRHTLRAVTSAAVTIDGQDTYPTTNTSQMIQVTGNNWTIDGTDASGGYIVIESINGWGIKVEDANYVTVMGIKTDGTYRGGIVLHSADYCTVTGNWINDAEEKNDGSCGRLTGEGYGDALNLVNGADYNTVSANKVTYSKGEGIGAYRGNTGNLITGNFICSTRSASILLDCTNKNNIVSYNFACNSSEQEWWLGGTTPTCDYRGGGIALTTESACVTGDKVSSGNTFLANISVANGVGFNMAQPNTSATLSNNSFYNNTAIDCIDQGATQGGNFSIRATNGTWSGNVFKDNLSIITDAAADHTNNDPAGYITVSYTGWHTAVESPTDNGWTDGAEAGNTDSSGTVGITKTSNWLSVADCATFELVWASLTTADTIAKDKASTSRLLIDPDSTLASITLMTGNELGAMAVEDAPPQGGDTGFYSIIGGSKEVTLGGTKTLTLSGE